MEVSPFPFSFVPAPSPHRIFATMLDDGPRGRCPKRGRSEDGDCSGWMDPSDGKKRVIDFDEGNDRQTVEEVGPRVKKARRQVGDQAPSRRLWVKDRSMDWWERVDGLGYLEEEFRHEFRMSRGMFDAICEELGSTVTRKNTALREAIPVRQSVAVCVWRLATGEPLRLMSKQFGLEISTCHKLVLEVGGELAQVGGADLIAGVGEEPIGGWPERRLGDGGRRGRGRGGDKLFGFSGWFSLEAIVGLFFIFFRREEEKKNKK